MSLGQWPIYRWLNVQGCGLDIVINVNPGAVAEAPGPRPTGQAASLCNMGSTQCIPYLECLSFQLAGIHSGV